MINMEGWVVRCVLIRWEGGREGGKGNHAPCSAN